MSPKDSGHSDSYSIVHLTTFSSGYFHKPGDIFKLEPWMMS